MAALRSSRRLPRCFRSCAPLGVPSQTRSPTTTRRATAQPGQCLSNACEGSVDALRMKRASETNEDALKVSPILEGLHVTPMAGLCKARSLCTWGKGCARCLDLFHGAFDFAATFDFDFAVSHIARDLAGVAHDEHAFAGDGLVQFAFDVDEVSFCGPCHHACSAD